LGIKLAGVSLVEGTNKIDKALSILDVPNISLEEAMVKLGELIKEREALGDVYHKISEQEIKAVKLDSDINSYKKIVGELIINKKVVRRGNKWCVIHCHGPKAGQVITCKPTKEEADKVHAAIMANKVDMKKQKPPKEEWDACHSKASGIPSIKDPDAFCGNLFYNDKPKWNAFVKKETKRKVTKCGCPVDRTITKASMNKLDMALSQLLVKSTNKL